MAEVSKPNLPPRRVLAVLAKAENTPSGSAADGAPSLLQKCLPGVAETPEESEPHSSVTAPPAAESATRSRTDTEKVAEAARWRTVTSLFEELPTYAKRKEPRPTFETQKLENLLLAHRKGSSSESPTSKHRDSPLVSFNRPTSGNTEKQEWDSSPLRRQDTVISPGAVPLLVEVNSRVMLGAAVGLSQSQHRTPTTPSQQPFDGVVPAGSTLSGGSTSAGTRPSSVGVGSSHLSCSDRTITLLEEEDIKDAPKTLADIYDRLCQQEEQRPIPTLVRSLGQYKLGEDATNVFASNDIGDGHEEELPVPPKKLLCTSFDELDLTALCPGPNGTFAALGILFHTPLVRRINLSYCGVDTRCVEFLCLIASRALPVLESIDLSGNRAVGFGAGAYLQRLSSLPTASKHLRSIQTAGTTVRASTARSIAYHLQQRQMVQQQQDREVKTLKTNHDVKNGNDNGSSGVDELP